MISINIRQLVNACIALYGNKEHSIKTLTPKLPDVTAHENVERE